MNKTTEVFESKNSNYSSTEVEHALRLAEEALELAGSVPNWFTDYRKFALAAIREALDHSGDANEMVAEPVQKPVATDLMDMLRLIETIKYLRGIAERGLGREIREDETIEQFVLGYVKRLEATQPVKQEPIVNCEYTAMQQALEALESAHRSFINCDISLLDLRDVNEAIIAIQTALQQKHIRVKALEEAAKVCDDIQEIWLGEPVSDRPGWDCAAAIRGLK